MRKAAGMTGIAGIFVSIAVVALFLAGGMATASDASGKQQADVQPLSSRVQSSIATEGLGILGRWSGNLEGDGRMEIDPAPAGYKIALHVSGPSGCIGSIDGAGPLYGDTITLTKEKDGRVCTISIKFKTWDTAEVSENNCSDYHGTACGFRGALKRED